MEPTIATASDDFDAPVGDREATLRAMASLPDGPRGDARPDPVVHRAMPVLGGTVRPAMNSGPSPFDRLSGAFTGSDPVDITEVNKAVVTRYREVVAMFADGKEDVWNPAGSVELKEIVASYLVRLNASYIIGSAKTEEPPANTPGISPQLSANPAVQFALAQGVNLSDSLAGEPG